MEHEAVGFIYKYVIPKYKNMKEFYDRGGGVLVPPHHTRVIVVRHPDMTDLEKARAAEDFDKINIKLLFIRKSSKIFNDPFDKNIKRSNYELAKLFLKHNIDYPVTTSNIAFMIDARNIYSTGTPSKLLVEVLENFTRAPCFVVFFKDRPVIMYPEVFTPEGSSEDDDDEDDDNDILPTGKEKNQPSGIIAPEAEPRNIQQGLSKDDITNLQIELADIDSVDDFLKKFC